MRKLFYSSPILHFNVILCVQENMCLSKHSPNKQPNKHAKNDLHPDKESLSCLQDMGRQVGAGLKQMWLYVLCSRDSPEAADPESPPSRLCASPQLFLQYAFT